MQNVDSISEWRHELWKAKHINIWTGRRIEAVVYAEEASPKDVMAPRLTADGILIQGFFPEADKAEVLVGYTQYEMEQEDEAAILQQ